MNKKRIRENFRNTTFGRDNHTCAIPGCEIKENLDAHHITPREDMPNGGYVKENGISLCPDHHIEAERFLNHGDKDKDPVYFQPDYLYSLVKSSYSMALEASKRLK